MATLEDLKDVSRLVATIKRMESRRHNSSSNGKKPAASAGASDDEEKTALAQRIVNGVARGVFQFSPFVNSIRQLNKWENGLPSYLGAVASKHADDEDLDDLYRKSYRLSRADNLLHTVVGRFLTDKIEKLGLLHPNCVGYRSGLGQIAAVNRINEFRRDANQWIVRFDVKSFNETVDQVALNEFYTAKIKPHLEDMESGIVEGTLEALFDFGNKANGKNGKGMVVGSGLTPPLTNLYLSPLDECLGQRKLPFIRYGDDIIVFCPSEKTAKDTLLALTEILSEKLNQKPSEDDITAADRPWKRGAINKVDLGERERLWPDLPKTCLIPPGRAFDFVGFAFKDDDVFIRPTTMEKYKARIRQYTHLSLNGPARRRVDVYRDMEGGGQILRGNPRFLRDAINRLNQLTGFDAENRDARGEPAYLRGQGVAWQTLSCADGRIIQDQFRYLDKFMKHRLSRICHDCGFRPTAEGGRTDYHRQLSMFLRDQGLRTFMDGYRRFPRGKASRQEV